jgi:toxin-antitoxin system PIN domain toxin
MILIDANILLYAEDSLNPLNKEARPWLDEQLSGELPVCFCWTTINAFLRISTNRRIFSNPLTISQAVNRVQSWLGQPTVKIIQPAENHWEVFKGLIIGGQASANLVPDAHLAALAIEHGCVLYSTDSDFSRFPKLKWKNPFKT